MHARCEAARKARFRPIWRSGAAGMCPIPWGAGECWTLRSGLLAGKPVKGGLRMLERMRRDRRFTSALALLCVVVLCGPAAAGTVVGIRQLPAQLYVVQPGDSVA